MTRAVKKKLKAIAENTVLVYEAGIDEGKAEGGGGITPFYYASTLANTFYGATFPENYEFYLEVEKGVPINSMFGGNTNLKKVKLKSTINENAITMYGFVQRVGTITTITTIETIDLSEYNTRVTNLGYFAQGCFYLKEIKGALDLSECTIIGDYWIQGCSNLVEISFIENTIKQSITFQWCNMLSDESIDSIINGLAPLEQGADARTLTLHQHVRNRLSQSQVDTIINVKGWSLLPAEATN